MFQRIKVDEAGEDLLNALDALVEAMPDPRDELCEAAVGWCATMAGTAGERIAIERVERAVEAYKQSLETP